ncbi:hypothetical protein FQA39_LY02353 [Lamprigera yunnana]|nr:hypothetical protein FQA39_LY02353 [Lamprigera yunnana]
MISESGPTADVIESTTLRSGLRVHIPKVNNNCIHKTEIFSSQVSDYHKKYIYKHEVIANTLFNGPVDMYSTEQPGPKNKFHTKAAVVETSVKKSVIMGSTKRKLVSEENVYPDNKRTEFTKDYATPVYLT